MSSNKPTTANWAELFKSVVKFSGDLTSFSAPPYSLSSESLTELTRHWASRPASFTDISKGHDEMERMKRCVKWFIETLRGQYLSRSEQMGCEKKPLNPILGESVFPRAVNDSLPSRTHLRLKMLLR